MYTYIRWKFQCNYWEYVLHQICTCIYLHSGPSFLFSYGYIKHIALMWSLQTKLIIIIERVHSRERKIPVVIFKLKTMFFGQHKCGYYLTIPTNSNGTHTDILRIKSYYMHDRSVNSKFLPFTNSHHNITQLHMSLEGFSIYDVYTYKQNRKSSFRRAKLLSYNALVLAILDIHTFSRYSTLKFKNSAIL